jgi:hypothetical protein
VRALLLTVISASVLAPAAPALAAPPTTEPQVTPPESCLPRETLPERTAVLGGTTDDDAEWVTGFGVDERGIQLVCVDIDVDGEDVVRGVLGGPFRAAADDGTIVVGVMTAGVRGGPRWHVVRGTVTDAAERVEVSIAGRQPVAAVLADAGPENGWRWYAIAVPAGELGIPHVTAAAYDADGIEIATGASPF